MNEQPDNPLNGITLEQLLTQVGDDYSQWAKQRAEYPANKFACPMPCFFPPRNV